MPCVYILLTRTDTLFARLLHGVGGNKYTHASLASSGRTSTPGCSAAAAGRTAFCWSCR